MNYRRVTKPTARKMYNRGCTIKLLPCKVSESALTNDCSWIKPFSISKSYSVDIINQFDRAVNYYEHFNCNAELGYYSHYFVLEEDYEKYTLQLVNELLARRKK